MMPILSAVAPYALPFGLALGLASLLRLAGGADRGAGLAGVALPAGFLAAWALFRGVGMAPRDILDLAAHVALGGALVGLLLDLLRPHRAVTWGVCVVFVVVCVWAAVAFPLRLPAPGEWVAMAVAGALAVAAWALVLGRLAWTAAARPAEATGLLIGLAGGLAMVAAAASLAGVTGAAPAESGILRPALGLACAGLGLWGLVWRSEAGVRFGVAALLGGGGALLALAQALVLIWPDTAAGLVVLTLALFAGGTARRLPGGAALAPLWTLLLALLCGALAAVVVLALAGGG